MGCEDQLAVAQMHPWLKIVEHRAKSNQVWNVPGSSMAPVSPGVNQNNLPCSPVKEHLYG